MIRVWAIVLEAVEPLSTAGTGLFPATGGRGARHPRGTIRLVWSGRLTCGTDTVRG